MKRVLLIRCVWWRMVTVVPSTTRVGGIGHGRGWWVGSRVVILVRWVVRMRILPLRGNLSWWTIPCLSTWSKGATGATVGLQPLMSIKRTSVNVSPKKLVWHPYTVYINQLTQDWLVSALDNFEQSDQDAHNCSIHGDLGQMVLVLPDLEHVVRKVAGTRKPEGHTAVPAVAEEGVADGMVAGTGHCMPVDMAVDTV